MKKARTGTLTDAPFYDCQCDWPEDCAVQAGDNGFVFDTKDHTGDYRTSFFEAFPRTPATFLRGEGATIAEAELSAWKQYEKILSCAEHEFERRGYDNGGGFCKHCGLFMVVFEPTKKCCIL